MQPPRRAWLLKHGVEMLKTTPWMPYEREWQRGMAFPRGWRYYTEPRDIRKWDKWGEYYFYPPQPIRPFHRYTMTKEQREKAWEAHDR